MSRTSSGVTQLIQDLGKGDKDAIEKLLPLVYKELRKIAQNQLGGRSGQTLSPTALVHEAYLRIQGKKELVVQDKKHFFAIAAQCMRWLLIDYSKARSAGKRGGKAKKVTFDENLHWTELDGMDMAFLEEALKELGQQNERLCQVVELRFLTGLSVEETAEVLKVSRATVNRDWQFARAWLIRAFANRKEAA